MSLGVSRIFLYPVKECNPFEVSSWELSSTGTLVYDREWAVLGPDGEPLTQPRVPALCYVFPKIDLKAGTLTLEARGMHPLVLRITEHSESTSEESVSMCGKRLETASEPKENIAAASAWFTKLLGVQCSWARASNKSRDGLKFMYKSNFFVTSQASFDDMHRRLPTEYKDRVDIVNFRSNIVVSGGEPYQEEAWKAIRIGGHTFEKVKLCKVCKATLVDRSSASLMPEPLSTLSGYRSTPEGVFFGCLMNWVPTGDVCVQLPLLVVSKGMPVSVL